MLLWMPRGPWGGAGGRGGAVCSSSFSSSACPPAFHSLSFPLALRRPQGTQHENAHAVWLPYIQTHGSLCPAPSQPTCDSRTTPVGVVIVLGPSGPG